MAAKKKVSAKKKVALRKGVTKRAGSGRPYPVDEYGMTHHERLVADAYVARGFADGAGAVASVRNHDKPTLSDRSHASELIRRPQVQAYLDHRRREYSRQYDATADRVINELASLAFVNLRDLYDPVTEEPLSPDRLPERAAAALQRMEVVHRRVGEDIEERGYRYAIHDKGQNLDRLGRVLGLFEQDNRQKVSAFVEGFFGHAATVTARSVPRPLGSSTDGPDGVAGPDMASE